MRWRKALLIEGVAFVNFIEAVRSKKGVYAEYSTGETEFYSLGSDPFEMQNRTNDSRFARKKAELEGDLAQLKSCVGEGCWLSAALKAPNSSSPVRPRRSSNARRKAC